jgi:putative membrane-bound dehydrogenase-like protein
MNLLTSPFLRAVIPLIVAAFSLLAQSAEPPISAADLPRTAPTPATNALSTFQLRSGIRLELVAAEPLVMDPIAMCFDEDSRLFVVEMRDYSERRDEQLGRIRMLEDANDDGIIDKSTVFAEGLPWPTALIWYNGGLFVGATPDILYFKDTNNDGKADERRVIFTGFGSTAKRLNVQALLNSFTWGMDNRIHGANGGNGGTIVTKVKDGVPPLELGSSDFSFDPRTFEIRRENGGGQYGLAFDNAGRKFICSNSAHIRQVMYDYSSVLPDMQYPLPPPALDIPVDGANAPVFRISPEEPWRVIRTKWRVSGLVAGPVEGGGRSSGYFTSATGITIYRGTALGTDFLGDAFIADVGSNLIHRKKLRPNGVAYKAERASDEPSSEFIASRDLWFRPVAFANAPDGALYFADMYREVIEHPWSIPENMKKLIDLNSGNDRGRIYRVVATNFTQLKLPKLSRASEVELVNLLSHPNGWHRDTAARLLFERASKDRFDGTGTLRPDAPRGAMLKSEVILTRARGLLRTNSPSAQLHALSVLEGLELLGVGQPSISLDEIEVLFTSWHAEVRERGIQFLSRHKPSNELLARLADDPAPRVRYQLTWALAAMNPPNKTPLFRTLLAKAQDVWEKHAVYAAISRDPGLRAEFPEAFARRNVAQTTSLPAKTTATPTPPITASRAEAVKTYRSALDLKGDAAKGRTIYLERCASCHRLFGQGTPVGPDLESVRTAGRETTLINILDPNREVQPRYATQEITTRDDEEVTGIVANDAPNGLTIRLANGAETFIPRTAIKSSRASGISLMPEGLESGLSPQAMADLLAYIVGE